MPLTNVDCHGTKVMDLSPLKDTPLKELRCDFDPKRDTEILRSIKTLEKINGLPVAEFWRQVEAGKTLPPTDDSSTSAIIADAFVREVATLPAEEQLVRVVAKLQQLNPGYDGKEWHKIEKGTVTFLHLSARAVKDISPVRVLKGLEHFTCSDERATQTLAPLADLSPLRGLRLTTFFCDHTEVSDLSPLAGMPLADFHCNDCPIADLTPLRGMPLKTLRCNRTRVSDLLPLVGMPLIDVECDDCPIGDLTPLRGMPLQTLVCHGTSVSDLSVLQGMPLTKALFDHANVKDLSPIRNAPLTELRCDFDPNRDTEILRSIKTLEKINGLPVAEFWKRVEAGKIPLLPK